MKPPPATGAHGGDGVLSLPARFILLRDRQRPQAPASPRGKEGGSSDPRADGLRARGFGPGQLLHNRAELQARASGPSPACLPSPASSRPRQLPACFPRQGPGLRGRLLLSPRAGCPLPPVPSAVHRCFHSRGSASSPGSLLYRLSCLPFTLQRACLLSAALPCAGLFVFCAAPDGAWSPFPSSPFFSFPCFLCAPSNRITLDNEESLGAVKRSKKSLLGVLPSLSLPSFEGGLAAD